MYVTYFGIIQQLAQEHGYALCVHGSIVRDFDLIAVPFDDVVKPHLELLDAIKKVIVIEKNSKEVFDKVGYEPHGRICYTIECGGGGYFDISFTPSIQDAIEKIKRDAAISKEIEEILNLSK